MCLEGNCCSGNDRHHGGGCCCGCCDCCSIFCLSYMHWISLIRAIFLTIHTLIIGFSIFGMIWANVYFEHFDKAFSGSYIGGHLATLSAGKLEFFLLNRFNSLINFSYFCSRWFNVRSKWPVCSNQASSSATVRSLCSYVVFGYATGLHLAASDAS